MTPDLYLKVLDRCHKVASGQIQKLNQSFGGEPDGSSSAYTLTGFLLDRGDIEEEEADRAAGKAPSATHSLWTFSVHATPAADTQLAQMGVGNMEMKYTFWSDKSTYRDVLMSLTKDEG